MKKNKIANLVLTGVALLGMTSCLSGNNSDNMSYSQTYSRFFNVIFEAGETEPIYRQGVGYKVEYNFSTMTVNFDITGLSLPNSSYGTLSFNNLPWTYENDWKKISVKDVTPTSSLAVPTFRNLNFCIYDRMITSSTYYPCMKINYVIGDNQYLVYSYPGGIINVGKAVVTGSDGTDYTQSDNEQTIYMIQLYDGDTNTNLNDKAQRVAILTMDNMKFTSNMIAKDIQIPNIPYDITDDGTIYFAVDEVVPNEVSSTNTLTPLNNYKITNLSCITNAANFMTMSFKCTVQTDDEPVIYNVVVQAESPKF